MTLRQGRILFPDEQIVGLQQRVQREKADTGVQFRGQQVAGDQQISQPALNQQKRVPVDHIIRSRNVQALGPGMCPLCDRLLQPCAAVHDEREILNVFPMDAGCLCHR